MHLQELKSKTASDLLAYAEELEIENASTLRTQDMMFAILKQLAENDIVIRGTGVLEVLSDGFGFCARRNQTICPGRMIFIFHLARSDGLGCAQAIQWKARLEPQKMGSGILLC